MSVNELYYHQQYILRLPQNISEQIRNILNNNKLNETGINVEVIPQGLLSLSFSFFLF